MRTSMITKTAILVSTMFTMSACDFLGMGGGGGSSAPASSAPAIAPSQTATQEALSAATTVSVVTCANGTQGLHVVLADGTAADVACGGANGSNGAAGAAGSVGAQGPQGLQGLTGATGPQGPQGPAGATGATGAQGPQGPQGPAGTSGKEMHVYDNAGAKVANMVYLSGVYGVSNYYFYDVVANAVLSYDNTLGTLTNTGTSGGSIRVMYSSSSCTGTAYIGASTAGGYINFAGQLVGNTVAGLSNNAWRTRGVVGAFTVASYQDATGACYTTSSANAISKIQVTADNLTAGTPTTISVPIQIVRETAY